MTSNDSKRVLEPKKKAFAHAIVLQLQAQIISFPRKSDRCNTVNVLALSRQRYPTTLNN